MNYSAIVFFIGVVIIISVLVGSYHYLSQSSPKAKSQVLPGQVWLVAGIGRVRVSHIYPSLGELRYITIDRNNSYGCSIKSFLSQSTIITSDEEKELIEWRKHKKAIEYAEATNSYIDSYEN